MEHLRKLAKEDKPFFLQYWPLYPLTGPRTAYEEYTTPNGGTYVEKMKLVDQWIGELMAEMEKGRRASAAETDRECCGA